MDIIPINLDQRPMETSDSSSGSAESVAALLNDQHLRCRHPQKYRINTDGEPASCFPYPSCLGFFHVGKTGVSVSYVHLSKLCRSCCDKAIPNGQYNVWSVLAGCNPSDVSVIFGNLKPSGDCFPPIFEVGTEDRSTPKILPIPDTAGASKAWQWLQSQAKPFYIDQLHLLRVLSPTARKRAAKDSAIAIKFGITFTTSLGAITAQPTAKLDLPSTSSGKSKKTSSKISLKAKSTNSDEADIDHVGDSLSAVKIPGESKSKRKKSGLIKDTDADEVPETRPAAAVVSGQKSKVSAKSPAGSLKDKSVKSKKHDKSDRSSSLKTVESSSGLRSNSTRKPSPAQESVTEGGTNAANTGYSKVKYTKTWGWYDPYPFDSPTKSPALSDFLRVAESRGSTVRGAPETQSLDNYLQKNLKLERDPKLLGPGKLLSTEFDKEASRSTGAKVKSSKEAVGITTTQPPSTSTSKVKSDRPAKPDKATKSSSLARKQHSDAHNSHSVAKTDPTSKSKEHKGQASKSEKKVRSSTTTINEKVTEKVVKSTVHKELRGKESSHGSLRAVGSAVLKLAENKINEAASKTGAGKKHEKPHTLGHTSHHPGILHHDDHEHGNHPSSQEDGPLNHSSTHSGPSHVSSLPSGSQDPPTGHDHPTVESLPEPANPGSLNTSSDADAVQGSGETVTATPNQLENPGQNQQPTISGVNSDPQATVPHHLYEQNVQSETSCPGGSMSSGPEMENTGSSVALDAQISASTEATSSSETQPISGTNQPSVSVQSTSSPLEAPSQTNVAAIAAFHTSQSAGSENPHVPNQELDDTPGSVELGGSLSQTVASAGVPPESLGAQILSPRPDSKPDGKPDGEPDGKIGSNLMPSNDKPNKDTGKPNAKYTKIGSSMGSQNGLSGNGPPQHIPLKDEKKPIGTLSQTGRKPHGFGNVLLAGAVIGGAAGAVTVAVDSMNSGGSAAHSEHEMEGESAGGGSDEAESNSDSDSENSDVEIEHDSEDEDEEEHDHRASDDESNDNTGEDSDQEEADTEPPGSSSEDETSSDKDEQDNATDNSDDGNGSDENEDDDDDGDEEQDEDETSANVSDEEEHSGTDSHDSGPDETDSGNDTDEDVDHEQSSDESHGDDLSDQEPSDDEVQSASDDDSDEMAESDGDEDQEPSSNEPSDDEDHDNEDGDSDDGNYSGGGYGSD